MGSEMVPIANSLALWGPSARVTSCPAIDFLDALALHASMQSDADFAAPGAGRGALREEDGEEWCEHSATNGFLTLCAHGAFGGRG